MPNPNQAPVPEIPADRLITVPEEFKVAEAIPETPATPEKVELISGLGTTEVVDNDPKVNEMRTVGGYSNITTIKPGTRYEPGMPISIDAVTNPQTGDPQVPKIT